MLVVSLHDICPRFEKQTLRWLELLDQWGIATRSLAVVPFYEEDRHLTDCPSLVNLLRGEQARGSEVVLHGYSHRFSGHYRGLRDRLRDRLTTRGCAEFSCLDEQSAMRLISVGIKELQGCLPQPVRGFTAPGWWQSPHVTKVCGDMGLLFTTATGHVHYYDPRAKIPAPALCGLPIQRGIMARAMAAYNFTWLPSRFRHVPLARVALHPYDLDNGQFMEQVQVLLRDLVSRHELTTYEAFRT